MPWARMNRRRRCREGRRLAARRDAASSISPRLSSMWRIGHGAGQFVLPRARIFAQLQVSVLRPVALEILER